MASSRFQAVVERQADKRQALILKLLRLLLGLWGTPGNRYSDWDIASATIAQTLVLLDHGLHETRTLTRAYTTQLLRDLDIHIRDLPPIEDIYPRSGSTALEVYKRPVEQYLHQVKEGVTDQAAVETAVQRLTDLVEQDVMLTERDEARRVYEHAGDSVIGYRRVLHPELAKDGHSCGLCIVAATRIYRGGELMPLHGGCNCGSAPITADADPGLQLNQDDLERIYKGAGSTSAADLLNTRIVIDEHGELGPVLRRHGSTFRDVNDVNEDTDRKQYTAFSTPTFEQQQQAWASIRSTSERAVERLQAALDRGDADVALHPGGRLIPSADIAKAIRYHRSLISRYSALLSK